MKIKIEVDEELKEVEVIIHCSRLDASSLVQFQGTHKQIYVSRYYNKALKHKSEEKRMSK